MANYTYFQNFLERQIYIDLVFAVQILYREFPMLDKELVSKIENQLITFYENNSNTRVKPRTICAVLVYHYANRIAVTMSQTCRVFEINITWFRKKRKDYLVQLGIEDTNQILTQTSDWRLFTTFSLPENMVNYFKSENNYKKT